MALGPASNAGLFTAPHFDFFLRSFLTYLQCPLTSLPSFSSFLTRLKRNNKSRLVPGASRRMGKPCCASQSCASSPTSPHLFMKSRRYLVADPRPSRGSMFRIYRDTRFSHDKRPYKTHVAMRFSHRGKDVHSPGYYLHLEPGGCFAASGLWHPEPPTLLKVRNAIVSRPKDWRAVRKLLNWDDASKLKPSATRVPCRSRICRRPQAARPRHRRQLHRQTSLQPKLHVDLRSAPAAQCLPSPHFLAALSD